MRNIDANWQKTMLFLLCMGVVLLWGQVPSQAELPTSWHARGIGGGGSMFSPSFSPHSLNEIYVACDMGELFHTTDFGYSWNVVPFYEVWGGRYTCVQFSDDPAVLYSLYADSASGGNFPVTSTDAGLTWNTLGSDPTGGEAYSFFADSTDGDRLIISDYSRMYFSSNGGLSFSEKYYNGGGNGCYIAGVFFDGSTIYVATNAGLLISTNSGSTFSPTAYTGIPSGEYVLSFTGAKVGGTTRFFMITQSSMPYPGIDGGEFWDYSGIYSFDVGSSAWVQRDSGISGGYPFFIGMARNNINVVYAAGGGGGSGYDPIVFKTIDAGLSWSTALFTINNANVYTGWCGYQGDRVWSYAEYPFGFAVSPLNADLAVFSDMGFVHGTTDGGTTWRQMYVHPDDQNPAGNPTPQKHYYRSVGLENTTSYYLLWVTENILFASFCDIRGIRSLDGGLSWSFDYTGHTENSMYQVVLHPTSGYLYGGTSTAHDIYQSTYLSDSALDGQSGRILSSSDQGHTWQVVHNFGHPVICLAIDPNSVNTMYASVIHSTSGGIYVTHNLQAGAGSTWSKLSDPPRTEGHPFNIHVLNDGTLVSTYSGHRDPGFTASSGVFVSTDGGVSWLDRSDPGMLYWTKDLVISPYDPAQNTWYVGVFSGWGGPPNGLGGLYYTSDRGLNWTRICDADRVTSCTINPADPDEMFVTTEEDGLLYSSNATSASPTFNRVDDYPFHQPERVYYNPYNTNEIWVTSFGNGLRVGQIETSTVGLVPAGEGATNPLTVTKIDTTLHIDFDPASGASLYNVYRGNLDDLLASGIYCHDLRITGYACDGTPETTVNDLTGGLDTANYFYLANGNNGLCEGSFGNNSEGVSRESSGFWPIEACLDPCSP
ncbi:hypothetical protein JXQ70_15825 [bacterium]|nr:hypothetical protein [bacterium]